MWHRRRGSKIARTRRALGVPAVTRNVSALIAEVLEDRTLLAGIADGSAESWAELLGENDSVKWLLSCDAVAWIAGTSSDTELADVVVQVDADSSWQDFVRPSASAEESDSIDSQVLMVVEWSATSSASIRAGAADAVEAPFIQITIRMATDSLIATEMPEHLDLQNNTPTFQGSKQSDIGLPTDALVPVIAKFGESAKPVGSDFVMASFTVEELVSSVTNVDIGGESRTSSMALPDFESPRRNVELTGVAHELTGLRSEDFSLPSVNASKARFVMTLSANVPVEPDSVSFEPVVSLAAWNSTDTVEPSDVVVSAMTPVEGLQAAAAPVFAVIETMLASLDTAARALLALLTGSGGSSSLVAPIAQPIFDSTQIVLDPKRPRWALHDGLVEELAAYSLVVTNDQHFDLKDFGPASRGADPVVRIEFDGSPLHGQVAATGISGAFRYLADPGFTGVDAARFRVTRASGQTVAGVVAIFVSGHHLPDRAAAPIRQVELPVDEPRVSAIDAGFRLSDGWLDLP